MTIYTLSLAPSVTLEDSGEFLTAAYNLGIPHPPGYPLWCLLAHPFTWIPIGSIAERVHFFDALCGAGVCFMIQRIGVRLGGHPWIALLAALQLAITPSLWSQSVIAEVYSLNALLVGISIYAAIGFVDQPTPRNLSFLAGSIGLGATNHHLAPYVSIPLVVWVLVRHPRLCIKPVYWLPAFLWLALGLSVYSYLPIRAAANPVPNVGNPVTWSAAFDHITRRTYSTGSETIRFAESSKESAQHAFQSMVGYPEFESVPMILGLISLPIWLRRRPDYAAVMIAILLLNNVLLPFLINDRFNGGWMFAHRIYGIPANLAMITLFAGSRANTKVERKLTPIMNVTLGLALIVSLVVWASYTSKHGYRRHDRIADQVGRAVLDSLPENAALFPPTTSSMSSSISPKSRSTALMSPSCEQSLATTKRRASPASTPSSPPRPPSKRISHPWGRFALFLRGSSTASKGPTPPRHPSIPKRSGNSTHPPTFLLPPPTTTTSSTASRVASSAITGLGWERRDSWKGDLTKPAPPSKRRSLASTPASPACNWRRSTRETKFASTEERCSLSWHSHGTEAFTTPLRRGTSSSIHKRSRRSFPK